MCLCPNGTSVLPNNTDFFPTGGAAAPSAPLPRTLMEMGQRTENQFR